MDERARADRLRRARIYAGFDGPLEAAERFGWNRNSYKSNENGNAPFSFKKAREYAERFGVRSEWLYDGVGAMVDKTLRLVPLVGYVGAGSVAHFHEPAALGEVLAPDGSTDSTVAVEIRGTSLGALFESWLVFYDEIRTPVTPDMIGKLCVVGLPDGRVLVKRVRKARGDHLYHLESNTEPTLNDEEVEWAALVKSMTPR